MPRRVDPEPAAHTDDETEMRDLVIDVKPEPHPWPLQAAALQRCSPKEVPAPGSLEGAPRYAPTLVPAAGTLLALGSQNQSAPWTSPVPNPPGKSPLSRAPRPAPFALGWDARRHCPAAPAPAVLPCWVLAPFSPPGFPSPSEPPACSGPTPCSPPASSLQTASPGLTNTQIR